MTRPADPAWTPRIVVTVADPDGQLDPSGARRKNDLYAAAVNRAGGSPVLVHARTSTTERTTAFATMDGLLLSGGADIDPSRYDRPSMGSTSVEPDRDELEAGAWGAAVARDRPVLGVCRGLQAINVFAGGTLTQDVPEHAGPPYGSGPAATHPLRLVAGSRLATLLGGPATTEVNSYHHQGLLAADLAPGLIASAWADSGLGDLVEGLESRDARFVIGLQCHPERTESTPGGFEDVFVAFLQACREPVASR